MNINFFLAFLLLTPGDAFLLRKRTRRHNEPVCDEDTGLCSYNPKFKPEEFIESFPSVFLTNPEENDNILCPFIRLIERYGILTNEDSLIPQDDPNLYTITAVNRAAKKLGAGTFGVTAASKSVSVGQLTNGVTDLGHVNVTSLHLAQGVAHDCGLTFELGGTTVSDSRRSSTLAALEALQDENGRLALQDLVDVKEGICADEGVEISGIEKLELMLMWTFLGGKVRKFIEYSDVERFLNAEIPLTVGRPGPVMLPIN